MHITSSYNQGCCNGLQRIFSVCNQCDFILFQPIFQLLPLIRLKLQVRGIREKVNPKLITSLVIQAIKCDSCFEFHLSMSIESQNRTLRSRTGTQITSSPATRNPCTDKYFRWHHCGLLPQSCKSNWPKINEKYV